jgi:hypothetical protein
MLVDIATIIAYINDSAIQFNITVLIGTPNDLDVTQFKGN